MFLPTRVDPGTPHAVRVFVDQVVDLYLMDVHAMLRLPRPEVSITEGCNFAIAAVLLNVISGVSVVLFKPGTEGGDRGQLFRETTSRLYPWDKEPAGAIRDPAEGAKLLYQSFRNPLAHAFGLQDPEPAEPLKIARFKTPGFAEDELKAIEESTERPNDALWNVPTLARDADRTLSLQVEPFYWGVRELVRALTADADRMAVAERYLTSMLRLRS